MNPSSQAEADNFRVALSERLWHTARMAGLSNVTAISDRTGLNHGFVGEMLRGKKQPSALSLRMWAMGVGCSVDYLLRLKRCSRCGVMGDDGGCGRGCDVEPSTMRGARG